MSTTTNGTKDAVLDTSRLGAEENEAKEEGQDPSKSPSVVESPLLDDNVIADTTATVTNTAANISQPAAIETTEQKILGSKQCALVQDGAMVKQRDVGTWRVQTVERTMMMAKGSLFVEECADSTTHPAEEEEEEDGGEENPHVEEAAVGLTDNEEPEPTLPLQRNIQVRPRTAPGAVAIEGPNGSGDEMEDVEEGSSVQFVESDRSEQLFSATLVNEAEQEVVDAKPALEGFQALIRNSRFKYILVAFVIVVLVVVVPTTIFLPGGEAPVEVIVDNTTTVVEREFICGSRKLRQTDYRGTINVTEEGKPCQPWASQEPNSHYFIPGAYPAAGLESNYCRNPDGRARAFCIENSTDIMLVMWCDVPYCDGLEMETQETCGTMTIEQMDYRGFINKTVSGRTCQRWDMQVPHRHDNAPEKRPTSGLEHNYCRNPDGELEAWCYTTDPLVRWEYCGIEKCREISGNPQAFLSSEPCYNCSSFQCGSLEVDQTDYTGNISYTATGRECQPWASQYPHGHSVQAKDFGVAGPHENFCRNPNDEEASAWCFTTDPDKRWEYCLVPSCVSTEDQQDTIPTNTTCGTLLLGQQDYRGNISSTEGGLPCQRWDVQVPHNHKHEPFRKPNAGLEENFCRNPEGAAKAWCYTDDPTVRWQYCDVPACELGGAAANRDTYFCGTLSIQQSDYRGTVSTTVTGRTCQHWNSQSPHEHGNSPDLKLTAGLDENYCRNPDGEPAAWCYTTDPGSRWEFCDVPACESFEAKNITHYSYCGTGRQQNFRGNLSVSISGRTCQHWDEQYPHTHGFFSHLYPYAGLDENFCRNPDSKLAAWCFTTDPEVLLEVCAVPNCERMNEELFQTCGSADERQANYRGNISITIGGFVCAPWLTTEENQTSYRNKFSPDQYPLSGLESNFCRNPDGSSKAWCLTNDSDVHWDYCDVPYCTEARF